jgi:hypothetical protein
MEVSVQTLSWKNMKETSSKGCLHYQIPGYMLTTETVIVGKPASERIYIQLDIETGSTSYLPTSRHVGWPHF